MSEPIYFSGLVSPFSNSSSEQLSNSSGSNSVSSMLQEFFHYMGKIWTLYVQDPTQFKVSQVIDNYREFKASGGIVSVDQGLTLEESYFVTLILAPASLVCLLNNQQADSSTNRMHQLHRLPAREIVSRLQRSYKVRINAKKNVSSQLDNFRNNEMCPKYPSSVTLTRGI